MITGVGCVFAGSFSSEMEDGQARPQASVAPAAVGTGGGSREATGARNNRKLKLRGAWNDSADRLVQSCVLAARNGGGGNVVVEAFGMKTTIEVKQSRDSEPPLVGKARELHAQSIDARQHRQQCRLDKAGKSVSGTRWRPARNT